MRAFTASALYFFRLVAPCLALCLCQSCSPAQRPEALASVSAFGQPAGYYPGRAERIGDDAQLAAWLAKNNDGIAEIQRRIGDIKDGRGLPGCIGDDKYTCVATLAQKLAIADEYFLNDNNIFAVVKYDVNGKPVTGSRIFLYGFVPNAKPDGNFDSKFAAINERTHFDLTLDRDGKVVQVGASLPKDPVFARTQEEYDATGAYETISALTAKTCPTLSNAEVAKWIENTVKPASKFGPREVSADPDLSIATHRASKQISFCGRKFEFHSVWGNSVDLANGTNPHGVFGGMTIVVR